MVHDFPRGTVHVAKAEQVYPSIADGSVDLVISDGPYNMRKAEWDCFKSWDDFRAWYRPHVEAWTRACAPDATLYVWGTDDSASELRPLIREYGWTKRVRVTWDKVASPALIGSASATSWLDITEACDVYTRGAPTFTPDCSLASIWRLQAQGSASPLSREIIRESYLRVGKVASSGMLYRPLHVSQKPLDFYRRMILASSAPGATVLEPFGGTLRAKVAIDALPESEARRYIVIEPDPAYVDAVLAHEAAKPPGLFDNVNAEQIGMF